MPMFSISQQGHHTNTTTGSSQLSSAQLPADLNTTCTRDREEA